jgi:thioredoxin 1
MASVEITAQNFKQHIEKQGIVLLDWWAPWCMPCKMFGPIYERISEKHPDITFGKVNTEAQQELAGEFGISSIPTVMVFRDQVLLFAQPGMLPEAALEDLIKQVRALDMEEVKREVAKEMAKKKGDDARA